MKNEMPKFAQGVLGCAANLETTIAEIDCDVKDYGKKERERTEVNVSDYARDSLNEQSGSGTGSYGETDPLQSDTGSYADDAEGSVVNENDGAYEK